MPPKQNAFWSFVMELKNEMAAKGGCFNMDEVKELASERWKEMDDEQKKKYQDKAKGFNKNRGKMTIIDGVSVNNAKKNVKQCLNDLQTMHQEIDSMIAAAVKTNTLANTVFYFIHTNVFLAYETHEKHGRVQNFLPCEICIVKFTLNKGVCDVFHNIVNPGIIPKGYRADMQDIKERLHRIELPTEEYARHEGKSDRLVFERDILKFLGISEDDAFPVFYTCNNKLKEVEGILIQYYSGYAKLNHSINVRDIAYLHISLINNNTEPFEHIKNEADVFTTFNVPKYVSGDDMYCFYHSREENDTAHCCKAIVKCWCYEICEWMCPILNIPQQRGRHYNESDTVDVPNAEPPISDWNSSFSKPRAAKSSDYPQSVSRYESDSENTWQTKQKSKKKQPAVSSHYESNWGMEHGYDSNCDSLSQAMSEFSVKPTKR